MAFGEGVFDALRSKGRELGLVKGPGGTGTSVLGDAELARDAAAGDGDAYEELYRRHVESVWRVAQAVTNDEHDAADATSEAFVRVLRALQSGRMAPVDHFRPYLIAAARNSAIDILRRRRRRSKEASTYSGGEAGPPEHVDRDEEAELIAKAFRGLPERWRATLWLTEVEGLSPSEAAPLLGVSGVGARQLAMRARAGLRHRYLQAHVDRQVAPECRFAVDHLVTYAGGNLSPRDVAKVDRHLAACEICRERLHELDTVGRRLRGFLLPIPLGLGALAFGRWSEAFASSAAEGARAAGSAGAAAAHGTRSVTSHGVRLLAACSGALLAVSLAGLVVVRPAHVGPAQGGPAQVGRAQGGPAQIEPAQGGPAQGGPAQSLAISPTAVPRSPVGGSSPAAPPASPPGPAPSGSAPSTPSPPPSAPAPGPAPAPAPQPALEAGVTVAPGTALSVTTMAGAGPGSCTGLWVREPVSGCSATPPSGSGPFAITLQGTLLP